MAFLKLLAEMKVYFNRGHGLVGCLPIAYLTADKMQEKLIAYYGITIPMLAIMAVFIGGLLLIGWTGYKTGYFQEEDSFQWRRNHVVQELLNRNRTEEQADEE